ncbi:ABC transporter ATP-binding protein [Oenococcus alcoholitolerans]|uniref:ABC transporter ATP-binding protein n=1 Tax=Oenococcus alcoholitolerans TaxID=931074 RepID=UPI003F70BCA6
MPAVQFQNVDFKYSIQSKATLHDVSFTFDYGQKIIIAGPSGSGKTTIGHLINGLIPQSFPGDLTGKILINDKDTADMDLFQLSFEVGTVLQDTDAQFVGMTVAEDVAFLMENENTEHEELIKKTNDWLAELNLRSLKDHHPQQLSGGQKQRVSMAGVLSSDSKILLFDEPLANLDPAAGRLAIKLIADLQKKLGLTIIIIEHRLEEALKVGADRLVIIDHGRIVADDAPNKLLKSDIIVDSGLRRPLYISALAAAGVDLDTISDITDISTIDKKIARKKLADWIKDLDPLSKNKVGDPILAIKNLEFSYSQTDFFKDLNVDFYAGQITAIVGKNGSGKTTFSNLITGFIKQKTGQIFYNGQNINELSVKQRADKIGYVLQNPNQMISQNIVFDEVAYGLRLRNFDEKVIQQKVEDILKVAGLYPMRHWPVTALSFGQKKRVTIASVLVLEPKILLLDEPTAGQDYFNYRSIMDFVARLNKEQDCSVIVITHDMHLMLEYADRALVLVDGQIIADKSPAELLSDPDLLGRANLAATSLNELAAYLELDPIKLSQRLLQSEIKHE